MPFFGQEILEQAAKKGPLTEQAYLEALAKCRELTREKGIDAVMAEHKLDALVVLTNGPAHMTDLVNGDSFSGSSSSLAAVAGYPTITLPAGWVHGLPVGISLIGRAWSEPELIKLAYGLERALGVRRNASCACYTDGLCSGSDQTKAKTINKIETKYVKNYGHN